MCGCEYSNARSWLPYGLFVGLVLHGAVSEAVELYGGLDYIDFNRTDGEMWVNAGFHMALNEKFSVGIKANLWDDVNIFKLHARYYFLQCPAPTTEIDKRARALAGPFLSRPNALLGLTKQAFAPI